MARVRRSAVIGTIRGTVAGITFREGRRSCGIMRSPTHADVGSAAQLAERARLTGLRTAFAGLSAGLRAGWEIEGERRQCSAVNAFVGVNSAFWAVEGFRVIEPVGHAFVWPGFWKINYYWSGVQWYIYPHWYLQGADPNCYLSAGSKLAGARTMTTWYAKQCKLSALAKGFGVGVTPGTFDFYYYLTYDSVVCSESRWIRIVVS